MLRLHVSFCCNQINFLFSGQRFGHFMDNLRTILRESNVIDGTIVMDNAPVHHGAVADGEDDEISVKFLPPYSPFLNPIENAFGVLKLKLRAVLREDATKQRLDNPPEGISMAEHRLRLLMDLSSAIIEDQETITSQKVDHMCNHVMTYMHRCFAMADITH